MAKIKREQERSLRASFRKLVRNTQATNAAARQNNKSVRWFTDTVMKTIKSHKVTKPKIGGIYQFVYDAKWKKDLPYYDIYPLSVCIAVADDRWWSINLHYLPVDFRISFLEELLIKYANDRTKKRGVISNSTTLKIDWSKIKNFNPRVMEHAVTSYLPGHTKSALNEIRPSEWHFAATMPSQQFISYASGKRQRFAASRVWSRF